MIKLFIASHFEIRTVSFHLHSIVLFARHSVVKISISQDFFPLWPSPILVQKKSRIIFEIIAKVLSNKALRAKNPHTHPWPCNRRKAASLVTPAAQERGSRSTSAVRVRSRSHTYNRACAEYLVIMARSAGHQQEEGSSASRTEDHHVDTQADSQPTQKGPRKRTKTGCLTCRRRRIKCGEEKYID